MMGLQFHYVDRDNKKHAGHNVQKHKHAHHQKGVFNIDPDDEIQEITVYQDVRINYLGFRTYKGQHREFGNKVGEEKRIKYKGCTFGAVKGGYDEHIDYLVFQVHPLPEKNKDLEKQH